VAQAVRPEPSENGHPHENKNNRDRSGRLCRLCATGQGVALLPALLQMLHLHLLPALQCFHAVLLWHYLLHRLLPDLLLQPLPAALLWPMDNGVQLL
jgi:hypothetical protein